MKKKIIVILIIGLWVSGIAFADEKKAQLASDQQKLSYAIGLDLGEYLKNLGEKLDLESLHKGVLDSYQGNTPLLSNEEKTAQQQAFAKRQRDKKIAKTVAMLQKNKKAEEAFLQDNKTKEGIVETTSGLQYKVVEKGNGIKPAATDTVKVHYRGTLLDGTEFDSSYKRNEPAVFQVNQVIAGWQEALSLMDIGSTYELYIPAKLAYGDRGAPPSIEPGSMLIFKVELLDIPKNDTK